jgi:cbb3-type cytochrome oxidase maturation protein
MEILYFMVPLGLVLVAFGLWAFFWAVGSGQFDDLDSPGWSVLDDEKSRDKAAAAHDPGSQAGADAAAGTAVTEEDQK